MEATEPGERRLDRHITWDGLIVRRALDANPGTGQRHWTDRHFLFNSYQDAELGYAVTDHAAQTRTVTAGLVPFGYGEGVCCSAAMTTRTAA